jgi:hypothetical protein
MTRQASSVQHRHRNHPLVVARGGSGYILRCQLQYVIQSRVLSDYHDGPSSHARSKEPCSGTISVPAYA